MGVEYIWVLTVIKQEELPESGKPTESDMRDILRDPRKYLIADIARDSDITVTVDKSH